VHYSVTGDPANSIGYEQLPLAITYTGTVDNSLPAQRSVAFEYETRSDTSTSFVAGLRLQSLHRLSRITLSAPNPVSPSTVKTYNFTYEKSPSSGRSLLNIIKECDSAGICLPLTAFWYSYEDPDVFLDVDTGIHDDSAVGESTPSVGPVLGQIVTGDLNGDGCDDLIYTVYKNDDPNGFGYQLQSHFKHADYRLSSCYDAIASGAQPFPAANSDEWFYQLSPHNGGPNSDVRASAFNAAWTNGVDFGCGLDPDQHDNENCVTQLLALDLDLDGRADLLANSLDEYCTGITIMLICL
jgi:hypothetical protein